MWCKVTIFGGVVVCVAAIILLRKVDEIRQIIIIFVELYKINTVLRTHVTVP